MWQQFFTHFVAIQHLYHVSFTAKMALVSIYELISPDDFCKFAAYFSSYMHSAYQNKSTVSTEQKWMSFLYLGNINIENGEHRFLITHGTVNFIFICFRELQKRGLPTTVPINSIPTTDLVAK